MANWWDGLVAGGKGATGTGSPQEQKRFTTIQEGGDQARTMIRHLITAGQLVNQQPTGVIPGAIAGVKRMFGNDGLETQAREQLTALNNRMVMSFKQPGAGTISDAERESFRASLANPSYQRGSNQKIIASDLADQWTQLAKAKLAAKWREANGSLDAKSKDGVTFDERYSRMVRSPVYQTGLKQARAAAIPGAPVTRSADPFAAYKGQSEDPLAAFKVIRDE